MASSNQVQLLQLLVRTILPGAGAQGPALVERAVDAIGVPLPSATSTFNDVAGQIEALLHHLPDKASRFQTLRRKLAAAGNPGSGMAAFRDKAQLVQLLLQLQGVASDPRTAPMFTDSPSSSLVTTAVARPLTSVPVDELAAAGALCPLWVEQALVRDLVFVLQGVDGTHVRLDAEADAFIAPEVVDGFFLPVGVRTCVAFLGELGWMHRRALRLLEVSEPLLRQWLRASDPPRPTGTRRDRPCTAGLRGRSKGRTGRVLSHAR